MKIEILYRMTQLLLILTFPRQVNPSTPHKTILIPEIFKKKK